MRRQLLWIPASLLWLAIACASPSKGPTAEAPVPDSRSAGSVAPACPPCASEAELRPAAGRWDHLASVQAYGALRTSFEELEATILADARSEREAFEGMRFLVRALAMAADVQLDGNPRAPHFARMDTRVRKVGGDNPDGEYDYLVLDGNHEYRITGNVGSVRHLSFTVDAAGQGGRARTIGYRNEKTLEPDRDGNFTLWLTRDDPGLPGQWIRTDPALRGILVRQYLADRERERLATYDVNVVGAEPWKLPPWTDAEVARRLHSANAGFRSLATLHRTVMPELLDEPNRFVRANSDDFGADISGSDNLYMFGSYELQADEALIIEVPPLDVAYWNLAVESPWHETVDYRKRRTHRTMSDVDVDSDGMLRFVLAHGPTEHPNWLETAGHTRGFLTFRWVGPRDRRAALPAITRVPLRDLQATLESLQSD